MTQQQAWSVPHIDTDRDQLRSHLLATSALSIAEIDRVLDARQNTASGDGYMQILTACLHAGMPLAVIDMVAAFKNLSDPIGQTFTAPTTPPGYMSFRLEETGLRIWGVDTERGPRLTALIDAEQSRAFMVWLLQQLPATNETEIT